MADTFTVRLAEAQDIRRLAEVEKAAWQNEGTPVFGEEHFRTWLDLFPEGFFLTEENSIIVAYIYLQLIRFDADQAQLPDYNALTDHGYTRSTHDPSGNHIFGVTICSLSRGAGRMLIDRLIAFSEERRLPALGVSRIPDFSRYLAESGITEPTAEEERSLALHYGIECAKMVQGKIHPRAYAFHKPGNYPPVKSPDSVLRTYLKHPDVMLFRLLPDFCQDPKSRNFNFLLIYEPRS